MIPTIGLGGIGSRRNVAAGAALAFDALSESANGSGVSSRSWTHTPVGTPSKVFVFVVFYADPATDNVTGVTYGGQAMFLSHGFTGSGRRLEIWEKASPLSGAQTVVVTLDNTVNIQCEAVTFTGGDATAGMRAGSGTSATVTMTAVRNLTVTTTSGDIALGWLFNDDSTKTIAPTNGDTTERADVALYTNLRAGIYTKPAVSSSTTLEVTAGIAGSQWGFIGVSVKA